MPSHLPKQAANGKCYLNIGCGGHFSKEWNNLDLIKSPAVLRWDIRKGLPFPNDSIDYAYSSHVLEHMTTPEAEKLLREIKRVLKPGGIVRTAVPDLERICREYLHNLEAWQNSPTEQNLFRYRWITLELLDQMTRQVGGGELRKMLNNDLVDRSYVISRIGDVAADPKKEVASSPGSLKKILRTVKSSLSRKKGPGETSELHRWMYDRVSLRLLFEKVGYNFLGVKSFSDSEILDWDKYHLDRSAIFPDRARKPDSLYVEVQK